LRTWRRVLVAFAFPFLLLSAALGIFLMIVGDRGDGDDEEVSA
jgi:hypothetical protein